MATQVQARQHDLSWQQVDDEVVILDLESSRYLSLNGAAATLWHVLSRSATTAEALAEELASRYDLTAQDARRDTDAFIEQCRELGLLA